MTAKPGPQRDAPALTVLRTVEGSRSRSRRRESATDRAHRSMPSGGSTWGPAKMGSIENCKETRDKDRRGGHGISVLLIGWSPGDATNLRSRAVTRIGRTPHVGGLPVPILGGSDRAAQPQRPRRRGCGRRACGESRRRDVRPFSRTRQAARRSARCANPRPAARSLRARVR